MTPPFLTRLEIGNNSIFAFIPTLSGAAFKGGGKSNVNEGQNQAYSYNALKRKLRPLMHHLVL
jgi:hypothetical protein